MAIPPVGTRIELIEMPNDPDPIPAGSRGTVTGGCEAMGYMPGQIWVDWDNGRTLCLVEDADRYRVIAPAPEPEDHAALAALIRAAYPAVKAPAELSARLRELADRLDQGGELPARVREGGGP